MKILVANDGSAGGEKAVKGALDLARRVGARVTMVGVEAKERFPAVVDVVPEAQQAVASPFDAIVERDADLAVNFNVPFKAEILAGDPVERILEMVERGRFDLLVVGEAGNSALVERWRGGVSSQLIAKARCNVMVAK